MVQITPNLQGGGFLRVASYDIMVHIVVAVDYVGPLDQRKSQFSEARKNQGGIGLEVFLLGADG